MKSSLGKNFLVSALIVGRLTTSMLSALAMCSYIQSSFASAYNVTNVMRYGNNETIKDDTLYFTENMEYIIERFDKVKDLGIIMNDEANFKDHLEKALTKARQKLGWILRTFKSRNRWLMRHLFKTLVIPHYCSSYGCQWMVLAY